MRDLLRGPASQPPSHRHPLQPRSRVCPPLSPGVLRLRIGCPTWRREELGLGAAVESEPDSGEQAGPQWAKEMRHAVVWKEVGWAACGRKWDGLLGEEVGWVVAGGCGPLSPRAPCRLAGPAKSAASVRHRLRSVRLSAGRLSRAFTLLRAVQPRRLGRSGAARWRAERRVDSRVPAEEGGRGGAAG